MKFKQVCPQFTEQAFRTVDQHYKTPPTWLQLRQF